MDFEGLVKAKVENRRELAEEAARALLTKEMVAARAAELADRHRKLQSSFRSFAP